FQRTLVLSPAFSKVYHLLAQCQVQLGRRDEAVTTLKEGFKVADQRGDKMPRDDMAKLLTELGEAAPEARPVATGPKVGEIPCQRPGCVNGGFGPKLPAPPLPDEIGKRIADVICGDCWQDWFKNYSIKVINELRLDLSTEAGQAEYDKYMRGFFGFEE
ncbi:MAG TPA: Fe(2+)-trafficking protein, partial [Gemmataceae bacterium]